MAANHNRNDLVLEVNNVTKELKSGDLKVQALNGVSLQVKRGELLGIIGPSGSGKSTLLGLIGGLDSPTTGQVFIDGTDITRLNERKLTRIRNEKIGFVFQSFNLIPTLSALENVALPIQFSSKRIFNPTKRAKELLDMLGLADRMKNRPSQLSGGQQQRVAIARALANNPALLLGDEPTGNLDPTSGEVVMDAFRAVQKELNTTIIIVTHDMEIASEMERIITLVDGEIASDVDPRTTAQRQAVELLKEKRATGELSTVRAH